VQIVVANTDGSSPITLGDDSVRLFISDFRVEPKYKVQVSELYRSSNVAVFARGNQQYQIQFRVEKLHASTDAAAVWFFDHPGTIPGQGKLTITAGATVRYFPDATKASIKPVLLCGVSTTFEYIFMSSHVMT
jgi:hypothetical protein